MIKKIILKIQFIIFCYKDGFNLFYAIKILTSEKIMNNLYEWTIMCRRHFTKSDNEKFPYDILMKLYSARRVR